MTNYHRLHIVNTHLEPPGEGYHETPASGDAGDARLQGYDVRLPGLSEKPEGGTED